MSEEILIQVFVKLESGYTLSEYQKFVYTTGLPLHFARGLLYKLINISFDLTKSCDNFSPQGMREKKYLSQWGEKK